MNTQGPIAKKTTCLLIAFSAWFAFPLTAGRAEAPVKLHNWEGEIDLSAEGFSAFTLAGSASHLGRFTADGEAEFLPGAEEGSLVGVGVAVFTAANGDQLVGEVMWLIDADGMGTVEFHWRDAVGFSDGTIARTTGRFLTNPPPGATGAICVKPCGRGGICATTCPH